MAESAGTRSCCRLEQPHQAYIRSASSKIHAFGKSRIVSGNRQRLGLVSVRPRHSFFCCSHGFVRKISSMALGVSSLGDCHCGEPHCPRVAFCYRCGGRCGHWICHWLCSYSSVARVACVHRISPIRGHAAPSSTLRRCLDDRTSAFRSVGGRALDRRWLVLYHAWTLQPCAVGSQG